MPLIRGRIPPNTLYGVRIPVAFASNENWLEINRVGGSSLLVYGAVVAAVGIFMLVVPVTSERVFLILALAPLHLLPLLILPILRSAKRLW